MHNFLNSFMSNDSAFGRVMTKIGIIICANLMFVVFSLPVVTVGASICGLYRVMFKTLRSGGVTNPFKQFFIGFKTCFFQSTVLWILYAALTGVGYMGIKICSQYGDIGYFKYAIYGVMLIITLVVIYAFPSVSAFEGKIPSHIRNAIYFSFHKPWFIPINLFFHIFPLYLTYSDPQMMPLYAFCWFFFGFGAIAMLTSRLLIKDYNRFLPLVDSCGDFILTEDGRKIMPGSPEEAELLKGGNMAADIGNDYDNEMIDDLKKLDM